MSKKDDDASWKAALDEIASAHKRQGQVPVLPTQLPSGQTYTPTPNPLVKTSEDQTNAPVQAKRTGGKIKPRGVGAALRGHTRAKS